jgi:hypothetical protein
VDILSPLRRRLVWRQIRNRRLLVAPAKGCFLGRRLPSLPAGLQTLPLPCTKETHQIITAVVKPLYMPLLEIMAG